MVNVMLLKYLLVQSLDNISFNLFSPLARTAIASGISIQLHKIINHVLILKIHKDLGSVADPDP
jgi:hypothetical protein